MCVPSGDIIVGEWDNSRVNSAQFFKGAFESAPRPVREIFVNHVHQIQKTEEKAPFISTRKWHHLIEELSMLLPYLTSLSSVAGDQKLFTYQNIIRDLRAHKYDSIFLL